MNIEQLFAFNIATFNGLIPFFAYLVVSIGMLFLFKKIYSFVTPYDEVTLIKNGNLAASLCFGGAIVGFSIPMAEAIRSSHSLVDFAIWGFIAMAVQIVIFKLMQLSFPKLVQRIKDGEVQMGVYMAFNSIAIGVMNAACMSN